MRDCIVDITATWFAFEYGGLNGVEQAFEENEAARFRLAVNETGYTSTTRYLRTSCGLNSHITRKQFSIVKQLELSAGVHNIGVRIYMSEREFHNAINIPDVAPYDNKVDAIKFVFVGGRNIVIDAHEKKNMDDKATIEANIGKPKVPTKYGLKEKVPNPGGGGHMVSRSLKDDSF